MARLWYAELARRANFYKVFGMTNPLNYNGGYESLFDESQANETKHIELALGGLCSALGQLWPLAEQRARPKVG